MKIKFRCPPELINILPKPILSTKSLPNWLANMSSEVLVGDLNSKIRTLKHCSPFIDSMRSGFLIPLVTDVSYIKGKFKWNWNPGPSSSGPYPSTPLTYHYPEQAKGSPYFKKDNLIIKFNNFWTIEMDKGYSVLITHPFNRDDLPFRTLTGLVDVDLYKSNTIQFPAVWIDETFSGILKKGTPIAQCVPIKRDNLRLECKSMTSLQVEEYKKTKEEINKEPGVYRKKYRAKKN